MLSYPQYCRFRSLQRRILEGARAPGLQDPHLLALGGVRAPPSTRLMYCRDTFSHPALESSAEFSWQLRESGPMSAPRVRSGGFIAFLLCFGSAGCPSLSLRGRPRKRRGQDDRDSPTSSQSESWIDRMKVGFFFALGRFFRGSALTSPPRPQENVMGSVEVGCEGGWLPHPEEQLFLDQLFAFMDKQGSPIHKVPHLGFKKSRCHRQEPPEVESAPLESWTEA